MTDMLPRRLPAAVVAWLALVLLSTSVAVGGLAIADAWGWGTNIGWISLGAAPEGVKVCTDHLEGYAWGENVGWIRMGTATGCAPHTYRNTSDADYGVNIADSGNLEGYAWGTNVGWIKFGPSNGNVRLDPPTGKLSGHAWSENAGWIRFDAQYGAGIAPTATVSPPTTATSTATGTPPPTATQTVSPPTPTRTPPATATGASPAPAAKVYLPALVRNAPSGGTG